MRGLATNVEHMVMAVISQREMIYNTHYHFHTVFHEADNDSISYLWQFIKKEVGSTFIIVVNLNSDIN